MDNKKYDIIYADPPWQYNDKCNAGKRGADYKYKTMPLHEIKSLPVSKIASDNCRLFLWVTKPFLFEAKEVIEAWGFKYKTGGFTWIKTNKKNTESLFWGMGTETRSNPEDCLLAHKGKPSKRISASIHSVIISPIGKHSVKPDEARDRIVGLCGDVPRIELFATKKVHGWDSWGDQIDSDIQLGGCINYKCIYYNKNKFSCCEISGLNIDKKDFCNLNNNNKL